MPSIRSSPVLSTELVVTAPLATLLTMYFAYGFYVLLFGTSIFMLQQRTSSISNIKLYLSWTIALFVVSTITVIILTVIVVRITVTRFQAVQNDDRGPFLHVSKTLDPLYMFFQILPIISNILADSMLIHRCHIIWGSRKRITYPLIAASIIATAINFVAGLMAYNDRSQPRRSIFDIGFAFASDAVTAAVNLILTLLTAGRVWWIIRCAQAHRVGPLSKYRSLSSINRIILESGMLYPISLVVHLSIFSKKTPLIELTPIVVLVAGIAPTLIIVRTSMGQCIVNRIGSVPPIHTADEGWMVPFGNLVNGGQSCVLVSEEEKVTAKAV